MNEGYSAIEKLSVIHNAEEFDCLEPALNRYLKRFALTSQYANSAQTYVTCRDNCVIGYYTLTVASADLSTTPTRVRRGLARHPVPLMLIARLAVDRREQQKGIGRALLKDALLRTTNAADIAGIRAIVVHAKDDRAKAWYEQFDFEPSPTDPYHLFLLMKDIKAQLK